VTTSPTKYQLFKVNDTFRVQRSPQALTTLQPKQVLIKMGAASMNYRDLLVLRDPSTKEGIVPLSDGSGTVVSVGSEVTSWRAGDRVCQNFFPNWTNGPFLGGYLTNALGGGAQDGALSEYTVADESALVEIPEHLTLCEAATLPCAGVTAWHALFERGCLQAGETVLVQGTGGVALFGLQLAVAHGAKVIVTSSSDAKLEQARKLGAWQTINYSKFPNWEQVALEITEGKGVDHILELGGPDTYDKSITAIAPAGKIYQIGVLTGFTSRPNILPLQIKNATIHGMCVGSVEHFQRLNAFLSKYAIKPIVDMRVPYEDAADAYGALLQAKHFGKIAIEI